MESGTPEWTPTVHALLRHLRHAGFTGAPEVVEGPDGCDAVAEVGGDIAYPLPWSDEGIWRVGRMLRDLHSAAAGFAPPAGAVWQRWWMHEDGPGSVIGHCDAGPWFTVARDGLPVAFVNWDLAGPVDRLDEVAAAAWWHAYLRDDDIAERYNLPSAAARARQLRLFLDGYGLPGRELSGMVERMIEFAIRDCAAEAVDAGITPESADPSPLWALAWRARSAAWMIRHRALLHNALAS